MPSEMRSLLDVNAENGGLDFLSPSEVTHGFASPAIVHDRSDRWTRPSMPPAGR